MKLDKGSSNKNLQLKVGCKYSLQFVYKGYKEGKQKIYPMIPVKNYLKTSSDKVKF